MEKFYIIIYDSYKTFAYYKKDSILRYTPTESNCTKFENLDDAEGEILKICNLKNLRWLRIQEVKVIDSVWVWCKNTDCWDYVMCINPDEYIWSE